MLTLAIDTTANTATAALSRDGALLSLYTVNGLLTHSETMLPMIEDMFKKCALTVGDIDLFAVSEGIVELCKALVCGGNKGAEGKSIGVVLGAVHAGLPFIEVPVIAVGQALDQSLFVGQIVEALAHPLCKGKHFP